MDGKRLGQGWFIEGGAKHEEIVAAAEEQARAERAYQRIIHPAAGKPVERYYDEDIDVDVAYRRRIQAWATALSGEEFCPPPPVRKPREAPEKERSPTERAEGDLRANRLHEWWEEERQREIDPLELDQGQWNEAIAARAFLRLLGMTKRGRELLAEQVYPPGQRNLVPSETDVLAFIERHDLILEPDLDALMRAAPEKPEPPDELDATQDARGIELLLSQLYAEVPGSHRAVLAILSAYHSRVRMIWERDGLQKDADDLGTIGDAGMEPGVLWERLIRFLGRYDLRKQSDSETRQDDPMLERAVLMVIEGESIRKVATATGIGYNRLRKEMRSRDLTVRRGPRKKKGGKQAA